MRLALALLLVLAASTGSAAAAARPVIVALSVTPQHLNANGGSITVTAHVQGAVRCTFLLRHSASAAFYPATTVSCSSGAAKLVIQEPSNRSHKLARITFGIRAVSADGKSVVKTATVVQASSTGGKAPPLPVPLVVGLDICTAGPHCLYGPIYDRYDDYGNVPPTNEGDCTFAAVADWEQIVLGLHPDPTLIRQQFAEAGGTADAGLSAGALVEYWQRNGINGVPLVGLHAVASDQASVETAVRTDKALLVGFSFNKGDTFGPYTMSAGGHAAVVDGFTPKGPLVLTWGRTLQLTWKQWSADVSFVWSVSSSPSAPAGPGLTLTLPGQSASYAVKECWTQYTGSSASNASPTSATTSYSGSDLLARGPQNFWVIVALRNPPRATISGAKLLLIQPNGSTFGTVALADWPTTSAEFYSTFNATFSSGAFFFQEPSVTGQGIWTFEWQFPDGQTCLTSFTVS
jgi:hypothetical protein